MELDALCSKATWSKAVEGCIHSIIFKMIDIGECISSMFSYYPLISPLADSCHFPYFSHNFQSKVFSRNNCLIFSTYKNISGLMKFFQFLVHINA